MEGTKKIHLLIGCTGSIAVTRIDEIIEAFLNTGKYEIRVIFTEAALLFAKEVIWDFDEYQKKNEVKFYYPKDEWKLYEKDKSNSLIIDLRKWADVLLITPLSGNTLAKIATGVCDNLLVNNRIY